MRKILASTALSTALLLGLSGVASAGGSPGSIGLGAEYTLLGLGGVSVNFDQGDFHAGGFFGYDSDDGGSDDDWTVDLGGRFFYHAHSTAMSDFGIGGQVGLQLIDDGAGPDNDATIFTLDLGFQIRVFLSSNVALSATAGIGIATADGDEEAVRGDVIGNTGIHYYFF